MILQAKLFKIQHSNMLLGTYFISLHAFTNFQTSKEQCVMNNSFITTECQVYVEKYLKTLG